MSYALALLHSAHAFRMPTALKQSCYAHGLQASITKTPDSISSYAICTLSQLKLQVPSAICHKIAWSGFQMAELRTSCICILCCCPALPCGCSAMPCPRLQPFVRCARHPFTPGRNYHNTEKWLCCRCCWQLVTHSVQLLLSSCSSGRCAARWRCTLPGLRKLGLTMSFMKQWTRYILSSASGKHTVYDVYVVRHQLSVSCKCSALPSGVSELRFVFFTIAFQIAWFDQCLR